MSILDDVKRIEVTYDREDTRTVKCFCGSVRRTSIIPHLKRAHPRKWQQWCMDFVRLRNKGWSYKRIMWKYRAIFSWSVIDRETRKLIGEGKAGPSTSETRSIHEWDPDFALERMTIWDFKNRGSWALHRDDYRGNWPPQIPRNLILRYTRKNDLILDPFVGGGTTIIEAYLLGRRSIGIDLNPRAIRLAKQKMSAIQRTLRTSRRARHRPIVLRGDARDSVKILTKIGMAGDVDLVCAHPPYLNSIVYSTKKQDLSNVGDVNVYCAEIASIARRLREVLKKGGICAILVGDVRRRFRIVPLGFKVMDQFMNVGFALKEIIIKVQHQDKTRRFYENRHFSHYLLQHEYLFVFEKT